MADAPFKDPNSLLRGRPERVVTVQGDLYTGGRRPHGRRRERGLGMCGLPLTRARLRPAWFVAEPGPPEAAFSDPRQRSALTRA